MANFTTHLVTASAVSGVAATTFYGTHILGSDAATQCFVLGTLGGLLPDLDSDNSVILKIIFSVIAITAAFVVMFLYSGLLSIAEMLVLWMISFTAIYFGGFSIFKRFTVHRGIFHSIPAAFLAFFATVALFYHAFLGDPFLAWMFGFFVFIGYLIHLLLDEIYSVDLANNKIKRSFGTALKLAVTKDLASTAFMYLAVIVSFVLTPTAALFIETVFSPDLVAIIQQNLLPANGWFGGLR